VEISQMMECGREVVQMFLQSARELASASDVHLVS
jgi:hypothetical protein